MKRKILALAVGLALLVPSGCKFIKTEKPLQADGSVSADPDDVLITKIVTDTYEAKLLPLITVKAVDAVALLGALKADLPAAGKAYGQKASGEGAPWTFSVKGNGRIITEDRKSRAGKVDVDIDGDGTADLTLQLGPVIKGTSLRDVAPFYIFTEFRDQLQFAKLSRALNDRANAGLKIPDGTLIGKSVTYTGVFSTNTPSGTILVTAVSMVIAP